MTINPDPTTDLVEALVDQLTLTIDEVADWHYVDQALHADRERPLVQLLVRLVAPDRAPALDLRNPQQDLAAA